jgi:hypothetical protein
MREYYLMLHIEGKKLNAKVRYSYSDTGGGGGDKFRDCSLYNVTEEILLSFGDGTSCKTTVDSCNIVINVVALFSCADILHTYFKR